VPAGDKVGIATHNTTYADCSAAATILHYDSNNNNSFTANIQVNLCYLTPQLRTGVLLPTCPCREQLLHLDLWEDATVVLNSVAYIISVLWDLNPEQS